MSQEFLYHISDQPDIPLFEPRPSPRNGSGLTGKMVWAVDSAHLHNYLLPRDCPRVTFYAVPESRPEDIERLMASSSARFILAVEAAWLPEIQRQCLYKYTFSAKTFTCIDEGAGYYISRQAVKPLKITPLPDLLGALIQHDVELRIMPSLWKLRERVIASSLQFSIIRMRNATPPADGMANYHPL